MRWRHYEHSGCSIEGWAKEAEHGECEKVKYYQQLRWSKHLKTKMLCSSRFGLVEQQQKNDFEHSSQEIQLCNETLQKHNYLIEEHWSGHNQLDESHKMLRGEISNLKLSYYWTFSHPKRLFIHHLNTTLSFLPTGHFEELKSHFESFTTDANTKVQRQAGVNSELETKIEKAKSEQEVNHNESLSKIEMASKQASDDLSTVRENLEDMMKVKEKETLEKVDELKKNIKEIDVTLECLKSKQNNCASLAKANRSWLTEMSDNFGNQFQELKEQGFNNARDRQNIKEQINQMQTRIDEENHMTRENIEVHS